MDKYSENFRKVSKKAPLVEPVLYKNMKLYSKKDSTNGVSYLGKFLKMDDF